jgi:5-formyltetrahydrofolate cyclo-ligase
MIRDSIRKKFIEIRKNIKNKKEKSAIICEKVINSDYFKNASYIGVYSSLPNEVDTLGIIKEALKQKKIVACPRVEGKIMRFYKISSEKDLSEISSLGIKEPQKDLNNLILPSEFDLMIIPGVAFDKEMNRYGYGGGYYDKYLEGLDVLKVGIAFDEQISKTKFSDITYQDVFLDIIYTEKQTIEKY